MINSHLLAETIISSLPVIRSVVFHWEAFSWKSSFRWERLASVSTSCTPAINSDCMCSLSGYGKKFRHISFKEFGHVDVHKLLRKFIAQIAAGGSYQIKHNGYVETGSDFQRFRHGFHTCISDISKIQCQCMRVSGDLSYFCRMFLP